MAAKNARLARAKEKLPKHFWLDVSEFKDSVRDSDISRPRGPRGEGTGGGTRGRWWKSFFNPC